MRLIYGYNKWHYGLRQRYLFIHIYIHMNCMVQCYTSDIVGNPSTGEIINQIICYKHSWGFARIFWWFWLLSHLFVSVGVTYLPNPHDIDGLLMVDTKYIYMNTNDNIHDIHIIYIYMRATLGKITRVTPQNNFWDLFWGASST